jgi:hypothetical protein
VKQERGVSKYIKEQLVKILDIKNMEGIPELSKALDFTITQSFAGDYGKIGNTPPKLHSLIIGPPAIGKKLLIGAARILNPVFRESQSAKQTLSGLSASTQYKNGSMVSVKGVLPQANMGVAVIQDFHNKNTAQSYQIMDLLGTVMEEGHVLDSTSANTEHIARTSIHLDTNLRSDLYGVEEPNLIANMGNIPTNVISRLDFITFIERDTERQCMTASKMYETKKDTLNDTEKTKIKRELKCLVAYLRTKHKKVELKTVEAYMQKKFNLFWEKNKNQMEKLNIVSDQLPRSTNSIKKMVSAEARANNRLSAMKADVNVAFDFMSEKFKFLQKLVPAMRLANSWSMDSEKRRSWIRKKFAGVKFTIQELLNEYEKDYPQEYAKKEEEAHTRTFYRDLGKVAQKAEHGKYTIGQ